MRTNDVIDIDEMTIPMICQGWQEMIRVIVTTIQKNNHDAQKFGEGNKRIRKNHNFRVVFVVG